ncbi:pseudaminic acid cytidylyltransferase [Legionella oakridgensis]|uniref:pseudaminic acid cytidylyltransferase n=1 Tax=Legionella oakridgensis TaxID=29423 RepID=UPI0003DDFAD1|nr:pseudaminic acid cytidylyltransferase [Legionella oakridgensis]ETO94522.1 pseudaminic acid CMP-transferase [Legionella oakridgensis RV-2-2007]
MKIALIPARGGSKRIPKKNIKNFCGEPIISYSINAAINSGLFDRIIVSTDDHEIAAISEQYGAEVPFMRPYAISHDHATTMVVIQHAIQWLNNNGNKVDTICCLYATAPFTRSEDLYQASQLLNENAKFVFSATEFSYSIFRAFRITEQNRVQMFWPENLNKRSQDLEKAYHDAGMFYVGKAESFLSESQIFAEHSIPFVLPHYRVQDIDTLDDWYRAEKYYQLMEMETCK